MFTTIKVASNQEQQQKGSIENKCTRHVSSRGQGVTHCNRLYGNALPESGTSYGT